jgi:hypothetical protein
MTLGLPYSHLFCLAQKSEIVLKTYFVLLYLPYVNSIFSFTPLLFASNDEQARHASASGYLVRQHHCGTGILVLTVCRLGGLCLAESQLPSLAQENWGLPKSSIDDIIYT